MKASEARELTAKNNNHESIRIDIDKAITRAAKKGYSSLTVTVDEDHDKKKILESLRKDGFKCSVTSNFDPRDGETDHVYSIRW